MEIDKPIFIVGMPRSGTTLVSNILNAHSHVAISPETHFFSKFMKRYNASCLSNNTDKTYNILFDYLNRTEIQDFGFTSDEIDYILSEFSTNESVCKQLFKLLLKMYAQKNTKLIWGEKTPAHHEQVPLLVGWFPNASIIFIYRDPRDVSLSLRKVPWNNANVYEHAKRWKRYIELSEKYKKDVNISPNYLEIKYENLLHKPELTTKTICSHIKIEYEPEMLEFHKHLTIFNFDLDKEPWKKKNLSGIMSGNYNKWINQMPVYESMIFSLVAKNHMIKRKYSLHADNKINNIHVLKQSVISLILIMKLSIIASLSKVKRRLSNGLRKIHGYTL